MRSVIYEVVFGGCLASTTSIVLRHLMTNIKEDVERGMDGWRRFQLSVSTRFYSDILHAEDVELDNLLLGRS